MKNKKISTIEVKNLQVGVKTQADGEDSISLTDMAKWKNPKEPDAVIANWMRTNFTLRFLGLWELQNNSSFKPSEFEGFKKESGENSFTMSPKKWFLATNAIGIISKAGRYGGTYAHKDIAFEFASWLSPEFKLYLIKEFQRLKTLEQKTVFSLEWQIKRSLAKTNYKLHTDAIKKQLEKIDLPDFKKKIIYAEEADMLNLIVWGMTAKDWQEQNSTLVKKGLNIRDVAEITDLIILSNLETINAHFLHQNKSKEERADILIAETKKQLEIISQQNFLEDVKKTKPSLKLLKKEGKKKLNN